MSVQTGEVLLSINTSKTIYSALISLNTFRFVADDRILEVDTGGAVNESSQVAVRETIERAVLELVSRGASANLWRYPTPAAREAAIALGQPAPATPAASSPST